MKLLLFCTKAKPYLKKDYGLDEVSYRWKTSDDRTSPYTLGGLTKNFNGKIVAECDFEVEEIDFASERFYENDIEKYNIEINKQNKLLERSCLTAIQMVSYLDKKAKGQTNLNGYAIHYKNLHIFDEPKELNSYSTRTRKIVSDIVCDSCTDFDFDCKKCPEGYEYHNLRKAPQNMMKVWLYENGEWVMYILISIRSPFMCLILNRIKDIEIRKVVLKEMLDNDN